MKALKRKHTFIYFSNPISGMREKHETEPECTLRDHVYVLDRTLSVGLQVRCYYYCKYCDTTKVHTVYETRPATTYWVA